MPRRITKADIQSRVDHLNTLGVGEYETDYAYGGCRVIQRSTNAGVCYHNLSMQRGTKRETLYALNIYLQGINAAFDSKALRASIRKETQCPRAQ